MNPTWQSIAEHLRTELAEHGALLQLYNDQQECLFSRDAEGVVRFSEAIEKQVEQLQVLRQQREEITSSFAALHQQAPETSLRTLLSFIEADARPLLEALIGEVNQLVHRVRRAGRHNHHLISRTVSLHRETLHQAQPGKVTQTYAPSGHISLAADPSSTLRTAR